MLRKCHQRRLIPPAFVALVLENKLQHHGLAVCINSANDGSISCENFVKFGPVTQELTELICERQVWQGQKLAYFVEYLQIYWTIFRNLFTIWKRCRCRWWICTLFPICQGRLPWQPNNVAVMKANWYYVHSLHTHQMAAWFWFATTC